MRIRFEPHPQAAKRIEGLPGMQPMLGRVAGAIVEEARRIAPIREGDYKAGLESVSGEDEDGPVGRANANWWTSWFIEAGTIRTPTFAPLRQAMDSGAARGAL